MFFSVGWNVLKQSKWTSSSLSSPSPTSQDKNEVGTPIPKLEKWGQQEIGEDKYVSRHNDTDKRKQGEKRERKCEMNFAAWDRRKSSNSVGNPTTAQLLNEPDDLDAELQNLDVEALVREREKQFLSVSFSVVNY